MLPAYHAHSRRPHDPYNALTNHPPASRRRTARTTTIWEHTRASAASTTARCTRSSPACPRCTSPTTSSTRASISSPSPSTRPRPTRNACPRRPWRTRRTSESGTAAAWTRGTWRAPWGSAPRTGRATTCSTTRCSGTTLPWAINTSSPLTRARTPTECICLPVSPQWAQCGQEGARRRGGRAPCAPRRATLAPHPLSHACTRPHSSTRARPPHSSHAHA